MSKAIALNQFTRYFCIYTVASLFVYLLTSFTSPAGIIVVFVLLPFYSLCVASIVSTNMKNRHATVRYNKYLLRCVLIFQGVKILASPASCYGWHQGRSCYSFIQELLSNENLRDFANKTPHWEIVETSFSIALVLYLVAIVIFLATLRIHKVAE
ncbi:hypothetical protein [Pseudanabaena yagii]|uniref:Uncharacterized protein n=1 Tax=Pseudanabaena yagii GIHE-NHR1 TaxID=2722753 RepID=A0ABX1LKW0_9CYAN|nr:hypothetical protein [Pseudanabaena yagii]NMF56752.1 hypothetical protein [Pseudanabaena yagii GIHE-NHR1]